MRFTQLDVFGDGGLTGNPLAVVHDADSLTAEQMQAFAAWTNLAETTFLVKPTEPRADYGVRIFTPNEELPFAGHPTLGTAHAWLVGGGRPHRERIVQECGVGLVELRGKDGRIGFVAPPRLRSEPLDKKDVTRIARAIGVPATEWVGHAWGDNGVPWKMVQLADAAAVREAKVNRAKLAADDFIGLIGLESEDSPYAYEVRGIGASFEDPVTGSLNAVASQWLRERDLVAPEYVATQGSQVGRHGEVFVHDEGDQLWISGRVVVVITGQVKL